MPIVCLTPIKGSKTHTQNHNTPSKQDPLFHFYFVQRSQNYLSLSSSPLEKKNKQEKSKRKAMCNPKPTSPSSFIPIKKPHFFNPNKATDPLPTHDYDDADQDQELHRWPTPSEAIEEMKEIGKISGPTAITGLVLYSRAMISMLFLGYLGELELAGGSLSIGVANITGYSVLSGLAMGMEPICGQAYGSKQMKLLGLTLQRTILLLLTTSVPISFMWLNMKRILLWCNQDEEISSVAQTFIVFAIPDLFFLSVLHPLRIYLRTQGITMPLTYCSFVSVLLHVPLNFLLVKYFNMGIAGVALAMALTNLNVVILVCSFIYVSGVYKDSWVGPSMDCLRGWSSLLSLAIPTCVSVCLEWWWYELMIMLCGLLSNPRATIASMGILIQTTSLVYVFPSSLSLGVSTRVSNELGARRPARARNSMIVSLFCAAAVGVAAMLFTTLMRHRWGRFFTADNEILELTAVALPIAGLCELGNCPQTTGCGVLRGSARPTVGANINLGSFYIVGMPVAFLMGFVMKMGFAGLWLGLLAAQGSCALLMMLVLCRTDWVAQVERANQLTKATAQSSSSNSTMTLLPVVTNHLNSSSDHTKIKDKKRRDDNDDHHNNKNNNDSNNNLEDILSANDELVKSVSSLETDPLITS